MIVELAEYERAVDEVRSTPEDLSAALFDEPAAGRTPLVSAHVAADPTDAALVGFALWFITYSTWTGRHGIWVEDLFVRPHARGRGIGRALLGSLAAECQQRGYRRLEWWVLDWNSPALRFYESLGAMPMAEWTVHRLEGPALSQMASRADGDGRRVDRPGSPAQREHPDRG